MWDIGGPCPEYGLKTLGSQIAITLDTNPGIFGMADEKTGIPTSLGICNLFFMAKKNNEKKRRGVMKRSTPKHLIVSKIFKNIQLEKNNNATPLLALQQANKKQGLITYIPIYHIIHTYSIFYSTHTTIFFILARD
ncbi:hypothetical protein ACJX0J_013958, partial [Zea mays]